MTVIPQRVTSRFNYTESETIKKRSVKKFTGETSSSLNKVSRRSLKIEEIAAALQSLDGWEVIEVDGVFRLRKSYAFKNFAEALAFTNQVGALADAEDHHPEILTEWGKATVTWWTHTTKGLSSNDFEMAKKVDGISN
jgi:4a-hydroxytetrahydrobiopterin dehydratase